MQFLVVQVGKLIGSFHPHLLRISYTTCQAARVRKEEFDGIPDRYNILYIIYITYFMIHFLPSEPSCDHQKLDNPLFSLRFNDQSSKCRWICTNVPEIQKDLPQIMRTFLWKALVWWETGSLPSNLCRSSSGSWSPLPRWSLRVFRAWSGLLFIPGIRHHLFHWVPLPKRTVRRDSWESLGIKIGEEGGMSRWYREAFAEHLRV